MLGGQYRFVSSSSSSEESDTSGGTGTTAFHFTNSPGTTPPYIGNSGDETDINCPPLSSQPDSVAKHLQALGSDTNAEETCEEEASNETNNPVPNLSQSKQYM